MDCDVEDRTFTFDELDEPAKERARDKWRYSPGYLDHDWWEHTYNDAMRLGEMMGFDIGVVYQRTHSGAQYSKPDIWFSGFCSQGDGCCWSGKLDASRMNGAVARIAAECGTDDDLTELAGLCEQAFGEVASIAAQQRLSDDDPEWPEVTMDMRLDVTGTERSYSTRVDDNLIPDELAKTLNRLVEYFADWIYKQLEAEHDYLMSDEQVDESIDNACLSFDEDGNEL